MIELTEKACRMRYTIDFAGYLFKVGLQPAKAAFKKGLLELAKQNKFENYKLRDTPLSLILEFDGSQEAIDHFKRKTKMLLKGYSLLGIDCRIEKVD